MMVQYEHTQPSTIFRAISALVMVGSLMVVITMLASGGPVREAIMVLAITALVLVFILVFFHSMTIRVSPQEIALAFGAGLIRKRIDVEKIESTSVVHTAWYQGWGIRKVSKGWLYNVSGFDAVEVQLENGRRFLLGTDEPRKLQSAIEAVTG